MESTTDDNNVPSSKLIWNDNNINGDSFNNPINFYHKLDEYNKKTVTKHLKIAGELAKWQSIRSLLEKQVRIHKCKNNKRNKIVPIEKRTKLYYDKFLFTKKKYLATWDAFPSKFRFLLEEVLKKELTINSFKYDDENFNYTDVYYNFDDDHPPYSIYDQNEWILSPGSEMNKNDIEIMINYRKGIINFMDKCHHLVSRFGIDKKKICENEIKRVTKIMSK